MKMGQDDPKKCTAEKLCRMKLAIPVSKPWKIPRLAIVLNPSTEEVYSSKDKEYIEHGLVAIDCSWKNVDVVFNRRLKGLNRRLPLLLAGNPVNYAKIGRLSSAEAVSAALYIAGYVEYSQSVISIFRWGQTFLNLNNDLLREYRLAETSERVMEIEREYFP